MRNPVRLGETAGYLIYRVGRLLRYQAVRFFKENGLEISPEQWEMLMKIAELGAPAMGDLVDPAVGDYPNVTRMVSGLESMGFAARTPNPEDRRSFLVSLTDRGERFLDDVYPSLTEAKEEFFRDLDRRDVTVLISLLKRLEANLE
ncbi:MAG: MarR family winged helix-turn-helix transcriptional regulator [Pseudodesulfovibrio sp.]|uniref:MarR family winged helix-turn-helix transcriptional regulator n=1 Tax=Pseudodesulfovibrio sp. TaxID=2035812 RepID=UPI003D0A411F